MIKILLFLLIATSVNAQVEDFALPDNDLTTSWTQTGCTGANHYECINDPGSTSDGDTSYIDESASGGADEKFETADAGLPSNITITEVLVRGFMRRVNVCGFPVGCPTVKILAYHDSNYVSSNFTASNSNYTRMAYDITGLETWEPSDFNGDASSVDIGIQYTAASGAGPLRVSQLNIQITYTINGNPKLYTATIGAANIQGTGA